MAINSSLFQFHNNRMLFTSVAMCGLLFLFGANQDVNATNYFNWGVESDKANYGSQPGQYNVIYKAPTIRDCTVSHSGSCSMKLTIYPNDSNNQGTGVDLVEANPTYPFKMVSGSAVYYRWWMKMMSGFSWGTINQSGIIGHRVSKASRILTADGQGGYTGYIGDMGFYIGEAYEGYPGTGDPLSVISYSILADSKWHEYIVMVKPNTTTSSTDAQFKVWVDGILVGQQVNNFRLSKDTGSMTEQWGSWMVSPYFQLGTTDGGGTIYLDDFSTDDTWNSLIGLATLPAPANMRVQ